MPERHIRPTAIASATARGDSPYCDQRDYPPVTRSVLLFHGLHDTALMPGDAERHPDVGPAGLDARHHSESGPPVSQRRGRVGDRRDGTLADPVGSPPCCSEVVS